MREQNEKQTVLSIFHQKVNLSSVGVDACLETHFDVFTCFPVHVSRNRVKFIQNNLLQVINICNSILINPVLQVAPQKKVWGNLTRFLLTCTGKHVNTSK